MKLYLHSSRPSSQDSQSAATPAVCQWGRLFNTLQVRHWTVYFSLHRNSAAKKHTLAKIGRKVLTVFVHIKKAVALKKSCISVIEARPKPVKELLDRAR